MRSNSQVHCKFLFGGSVGVPVFFDAFENRSNLSGDSIEYLAADVFSFDAFEDRQKLVEACDESFWYKLQDFDKIKCFRCFPCNEEVVSSAASWNMETHVKAFRHLGIAKGKDGEVFGYLLNYAKGSPVQKHVTDRPTGESFQAMVFGESRGNQHLELGSKKGGFGSAFELCNFLFPSKRWHAGWWKWRPKGSSLSLRVFFPSLRFVSGIGADAWRVPTQFPAL